MRFSPLRVLERKTLIPNAGNRAHPDADLSLRWRATRWGVGGFYLVALCGLIFFASLPSGRTAEAAQSKGIQLPSFLKAKEGEKKSEPFPGVEHLERVTFTPRLLTQHFVFIELKPGTRITATGPIKDGAYPPGTTKLETTRSFLEKTKAQIAINANFFDNSPEAKKKGLTKVRGLSMSEGHFVSPWEPNDKMFTDAIHFDRNNRVRFLERPKNIGDGYATLPATDLYTAITGHARLLKKGEIAVKPVADPSKDLHPRTAIGVHKDGRLVLFVVDGRRPGHSLGMQTYEVAQILREKGVVDAIQMDGGGSTSLVFGEIGGGNARVINKPADLMERKVGNSLAIILPQSEGEK